MWARLKSLFGNLGNVWSMLSALLCVIFTAEIVRLVVTRGGWSDLPSDALKVDLDALQLLAFIVALTALLVAVTVQASNKFKDIGRNLRRIELLRKDTAAILREMGGGSAEENVCNIVHGRGRPIWFCGVLATVKNAFATVKNAFKKAIRWRSWLLVLYTAVYSGLRLDWAASHVSFDPPGHDLAVVRLDVAAAVLGIIAWSLLVVVVTERMVHMGRQLETDTEELLWLTGKTNMDVKAHAFSKNPTDQA